MEANEYFAIPPQRVKIVNKANSECLVLQPKPYAPVIIRNTAAELEKQKDLARSH